MKPGALVFRGGGVKNISYTGVVKYLEENEMMSNVKVYAGTSGGSFTAAMLNLGYTSQEMMNELTTSDFESMLGGKMSGFQSIPKLLYNSWRQYGMVDGSVFEKKLMDLIAHKTGNPKITFKELYQLTGKTLVCTVACANTHKAEYFSWHTVPNMPVYKGMRISMNLPPIFAPVIVKVVRTGLKFIKDDNGDDDSYVVHPGGIELGVKNVTETGDDVVEAWYIDDILVCKFSEISDLLPGVKEFEKWYVDGGLIDNYPVEYIEKGLDSDLHVGKILGFVIESSEDNHYYPINKKWPWDYFKNLMYAQYTELDRRTRECYVQSNLSITIPITVQNISVYEFCITSVQLQQLFTEGYKSIKQYFDKKNNESITDTIPSDEETETIQIDIFNINYISSGPSKN